MQLEAHSKVGARFKLVVRKSSDDSISRETEWFNNIVLDTGLARMSVGTWIDRCCVGTGNSTPVATQTALDSFLASTTSKQNSSAGIQTTTMPYYRYALVTWRFGQGVAAGNISEVGLGWGSANMWNRALIKDINGNPTTITVLSDEYLDVYSEIREYPALSWSGSFNLLDKTGAVISTHTVEGSPYISGAANYFTKIGAAYFYAYTGVKNDSLTVSPSGSLGQVTTLALTYPTPTSMQIVATIALSLLVGTHQSFAINNIYGLLGIAGGVGGNYKFQISPAITKTSTQIMTYTFLLSWGRYEPT